MNRPSPARPSMNPQPAAAEIRQILARELGLPSRLAYTALLLAALAAATVIGALLLTEPELPQRTRIAFVVMLGIGLSWAGFATWVLARRRVLFARHRIVAARMALAFTALFALGSGLVGATTPRGPWIAAAAVGIAMFAAAVVLLVRARARFAALARRRTELERELASAGAGS